MGSSQGESAKKGAEGVPVMADESVKINEWTGYHNGSRVLSVTYKGSIYNIWGDSPGNTPNDFWASSLPFKDEWCRTGGDWHRIGFDDLPEKVKQEVIVWRMSL